MSSNVTVSVELLDVSKMKLDPRLQLSKRRNSKSGCVSEKDENAVAPHFQIEMTSEEGKSAETAKPLDSLENIDRKSSTGEPKLSKEDPHDIRNLKQLLLLNLDLIKQQQDLLLMKDKQLAQYKDENHTLRCRLERMERRMSLLKGSGAGGSVSPAPANSEAVHQSGGRSVLREEQQSNRSLKRKGTSLPPQSLAKKFATIARNEYQKDKARGRIRNRHSDAGTYFIRNRRRKSNLNRLTITRRKTMNHPSFGRRTSNVSSASVLSRSSQHDTNSEDEGGASGGATGRSLRNRGNVSESSSIGSPAPPGYSISTPHRQAAADALIGIRDSCSGRRENSSITPYGKRGGGDINTPYSSKKESDNTPCANKTNVTPKVTNSKSNGKNGNQRPLGRTPGKRNSGRTIKMPKDSSILKTETCYYVPDNYEPLDPVVPTKTAKEGEEEVLVPTFRIKKCIPYYVIEGTENFDDEVYAKRHQKHELEEKKRKRWDLQRQRELEQVQKLQHKRHRNGDSDVTNQDGDEEEETFVPDPDKIQYIEVCDKLPVSVYGAAVPKLSNNEFDLPWFDVERREKQELRKKSRKR